MKKFLFLLTVTLLLTSCAGARMRTTFTSEEIQGVIFETLDEKRFTRLDEDEIEFVLSIDDDLYENAFVYQDESGKTIDEIGVFIADAEEADLLYQKLEDYVADCQKHKKEWLEGYNPPEAEKLKAAKLFRYGSLMGYSFLNSDEQQEFTESIHDFCSQR